jgi:hypothetical protein
MQGRRMREGGLPAILIGAFMHIGKQSSTNPMPGLGVGILSSE